VEYGCYRNSPLATLPVAAMIGYHRWRRTWTEQVDLFIALTEFARQKYIQAGLPADRVVVKPNFMNAPPEPRYDHDGYVLFLGRLSPEKGGHLLLKAWKSLPDVPLKLVGDGVQGAALEALARQEGLANVEFLGLRSHAESVTMLKNARFLVMPSLCYEGFPLTIREALACGKPVVASRLGAMASILEAGKTALLFEPGDPQDLATKARWLVEHEIAAFEMGRAARLAFEAKYTAEKNYPMLMQVYTKAKAVSILNSQC